MLFRNFGRIGRLSSGIALAAVLIWAIPGSVSAQVTAFKQAIAEFASEDRGIAEFYRETGFQPVWTGDSALHRARRAALLNAVANAGNYGLPVAEYAPDVLREKMSRARGSWARGQLEADLSRVLVTYSRHMQTGVLDPRKVTAGIKRKAPLRDPVAYMREFTSAQPDAYFRELMPVTPEFTRLVRAKFDLERKLADGGWGPPVPAGSLKPGQTGSGVVALRNRLVAMGYLAPTYSGVYDSALENAVRQFQIAHGLEPDGEAGTSTMREINLGAGERLKSVIVAMERERWLNRPRGKRHVWVNIPDFKARIIDDEIVTFETRAVVGKNTSDRQTPEFSDVMEYMEINPFWNVPRSITAKEYLPGMQRNSNAHGHLQVIDGRGRIVPRSAVNFGRYTGRNFPFNLRQPPSGRNALGLVKFMFPNPHNIYLHDTPAKSLFAQNRRAYSHGCIRLKDPFDFAYAILAKQTEDPVTYFQTRLRSGNNIRVPLEEPVQVHITYRTAYSDAKGRMHYRQDVYGRDALVYQALRDAGVVLSAVQG